MTLFLQALPLIGLLAFLIYIFYDYRKFNEQMEARSQRLKEFNERLDKHLARIQNRADFRESQRQAILEYCKPHLDQMWAAHISGILLEKDFRDAAAVLTKGEA